MEINEKKYIMTNSEKQEFWNTLCSFSGDNLLAEIDLLKTKIRYPRFLYRYQNVNNFNLALLCSSELIFSKIINYGDPFDAFLYIDVELLMREFESNFRTPEIVEQIANISKEMLQKKSGLMNLYSRDKFLFYILNLRNLIRHEIYTICFSDDWYNENLWLKCADKYRGYCLIYDLNDNKKDPIYNIYPVYYSDKLHDSTNFIKFRVIKELQKQFTVFPDILKQELSTLSSAWEAERNCLIKKKCHKYDREWRIINCNCNINNQIINWKPTGVILGLDTPQTHANLIIAMAQKAGIKKIYKSIINRKNKLDTVEI